VDGTAIGATTSHDLSFNQALRDATTKDSGAFEEVLPGLRWWSIAFDAMVAYDETEGYEQLRGLIANRTEVTLLFSSLVSGDPQWSGKAFLENIDKTAGVEESVTMSGSFKGTGELTETTIT